MSSPLKVLVIAAGLTALATPALAHGPGPGLFAPVRAVAAAVNGVGRAIGAVVPHPHPVAYVAPAPVAPVPPRLAAPRAPLRVIHPVPPLVR